MRNKFYIAHDIIGRLRIIVTALQGRSDHLQIEQHFKMIKGIKNVRIEPIISSMLVEYDCKVLDRNHVLKHLTVFFELPKLSPFDNFVGNVKPTLKRDVFYSFVTGVLLLASIARKTPKTVPDLLDYIVVISTAYTVLSHGETNKLKHPDVIAGILSMLSLGPNNIHQVSAIAWGVNLLEILIDVKKGRKFSS